MRGAKAVRRVALEVLGWLMVVGGIAALVLPGPGLILLFLGLLVLSQRYEWAERRLQPVKVAAYKTAADGVQTWPRIVMSVSGAMLLVGLGVLWGVSPDAPDWWPVRESWWLIGGWGAGGTLIFSGLVALVLVVYSYRNFRGVQEPERAAEAEAVDGA